MLQNNWIFVDQSVIQYTNWSPGEPNQSTTGEDCAEILADGYWNDVSCLETSGFYKFVCSSPIWSPNTQRIFEINTNDEQIADIIIVSIGNNAMTDELCIDSLIINDQSAKYISDNKIGGGNGNVLQSNAVIKYPVCATEGGGFRIDYDTSITTLLQNDASITGLECTNANRLISSTCSISQSYDK